MANTYTLINSSTVGVGGAASITFSSIPATYMDLLIKTSLRGSRSAINEGVNVSFNGSTSSFTYRALQGNGSAASSFNSTAGYYTDTDGDTAAANTFGNGEIYIPNYAGSNNKSYSADSVAETNNTTIYMQLVAGLWSNTAAITSISFACTVGSFKEYSTAYLYGIKNS